MGSPMIDTTDNQAIIAALQDELSAEAAFEAVYRYYYSGLCGFAGRMVPLLIAEEIVQNTMVWLWENRFSLRGELSLKSLLFTIVRNKALDNKAHLRIKEKVHQKILSKNENKFNDPNFYIGKELYTLFADALDKLPEKYRVSFEMSRIEGKTHAQIAEELGISRQTVNYHIGEAMKILKRELKDYLPLFLLMLH